MNLLNFFHGVYNMYDNSRTVDVVDFDFQKAYGNVPHKRFMQKVKVHGIKRKAGRVDRRLADRPQTTVVTYSDSSSWINVSNDVPQGSVL